MSSSTRVILDPKRAAEVVEPLFDFTSKAQVGDIISAPVTTASVWSGVDPNPNAILTGVFSLTGFQVRPQIQNGVVGVLYLIAVKVSASISGTLELDGILAVIPQGM